MPAIVYRATDISEIELIRPLWEQLNEHHHARASAFRSHYTQMMFDDRKEYFRKVAASGTLRIELAFDPDTGDLCVGYCVPSLSRDKEGEIESIFVEESFRSHGIGTILVNRALAWLDEHGSVRNRVSVGDGNEEAWEFYRKFGFYPRMTVLEQKRE